MTEDRDFSARRQDERKKETVRCEFTQRVMISHRGMSHHTFSKCPVGAADDSSPVNTSHNAGATFVRSTASSHLHHQQWRGLWRVDILVATANPSPGPTSSLGRRLMAACGPNNKVCGNNMVAGSASENKCLRRMVRISYKEHRTKDGTRLSQS